MKSIPVFVCWFGHFRTSQLWHLRASTDGSNFAEGRGEVKTKFCPNVARFCPVFVLILSISGLSLSRCGLTRGETFRTGSRQAGEKRVKIDGDSGAVVALVRRVPVHANPPRARATFEAGYDSAGADQV
ncbi:hypothetical protein [Gimesia panareensis]|uniref:hypothetical protein n=1 Tax=Gimesia panareensis TaxID=2527978 RepID=UPI0011A10EC2|nr:hypothetical protein [Gimesia panareensis]